MAILVKFNVTGMSAEKYDAVLRGLESVGAGAPAGRLYHVSYGSRDGLQVIDVLDSQQSLENFGKTLAPIIEKLGVKAQMDISEVHRIIKG